MLAARFFICHEYLCEQKTSHFTMIAPSNISINLHPTYIFQPQNSPWTASISEKLGLSLSSPAERCHWCPSCHCRIYSRWYPWPHPRSWLRTLHTHFPCTWCLVRCWHFHSSYVSYSFWPHPLDIFEIMSHFQSSTLLTSRSRSAENISSIYSLFSPYIVLIVSMSLRAARVCLLKSMNSGT